MSSNLPLSIQDILERKKQQTAQQNSPIFISKERRDMIKSQLLNSNTPKTQRQFQPFTPTPNKNESKPKSPPVLSRGNKQASKPQIKKKSEKFVFDWSDQDDTLNKNDPLYTSQSTTNQDQDVLEQIRKRKEALLQGSDRKRVKASNNDVHWSKKPLSEMKERDWRIFKEDFNILTRGGNVPHPLRFWDESCISKDILKVISNLGFKNPTPIQRAAIPIALSGRDVIGVAETGSGKTVSFLVPMLQYLIKLPVLSENSKSSSPQAIVLVPTRELALQIETETQQFCEPLGFRCTSMVGGHRIEKQVHSLQKGSEIVIATPGRLIDALERRILVLNQCTYVVMDEADRMIDMGFEEQVNTILNQLASRNSKDKAADKSLQNCRTMMYTATWPKGIDRLAENYLIQPGIVNIGNVGQATDRVVQIAEFIQSEDKRVRRLCSLLKTGQFKPPVIVFVNYKKLCDTIAKALNSERWKAVTMHGSKSQEQREQALSQLRSGAASCLIATDVAGRGIDVPNVSLVVNFQMAKTIEDYTHRIGRTGRAGKSGTAITFLGPEDDDVIPDLRNAIKNSAVSKLSEELKRYRGKNEMQTLK